VIFPFFGREIFCGKFDKSVEISLSFIAVQRLCSPSVKQFEKDGKIWINNWIFEIIQKL
jgi:hypothetical protein